ncbi:protoheme IX farnesyltransferase [Saccharopolyspora gloriosae]|uniref:Protoheme IX farnesyltransferase n=1 Tax=Saccharopolyspora gloriosae TaxID=455344 RepID=A0A840NJX7_9PSEU|nr:protoheme IX farnesyltransferase [Saccharopolyspora gloriosae]
MTTTDTTAAEPRQHATRPGDLLKAYLGLLKPRVIELLLVTTIPAMLLAERGIPSPWLVLSTLIGGTMAAGSANALNCVADADIDQVMQRTRARPLVRHTVSNRHALIFGVVLGLGSFGFLWATTNLLAAVLAVATILFYVLIYTLVLKRRTAQNIVWGGAAGCMPVVIGWAGVTGRVDWPALVMFGIIFFWTPPHTWALAVKYKADYERAGVPMLPVVAEPSYVSRQIVAYSWLMVLWTLLLAPATGWLYTAFAVASGAWFLWLAHRLHTATKRGEPTKPMRLFHMSNTYLMIVCVALAVDSALGLPILGWPWS